MMFIFNDSSSFDVAGDVSLYMSESELLASLEDNDLRDNHLFVLDALGQRWNLSLQPLKTLVPTHRVFDSALKLWVGALSSGERQILDAFLGRIKALSD